MKILFSDNTLWGLLNFRRKIIERMVEDGYQVVLVAPSDAMSDMTVIPSGVKYIPIELSRTGQNPFADIAYYRRLKSIYRAERPDYIFHYTIKPNIYGTLAARSLGIRSSAMIAGLGHVYTEGGLGNTVARIMYKYAMKFPETVMVLNKSNYDTLLQRKVVDEKKLLLLNGGEGVDLQQFVSTEMPSNPKPVFLMICRLLYEKGYAEYVTAANALKGEAEFRIMGPIDSHPSSVSRQQVEADVASGAIKYIEFAPNVKEQITMADCVVLPSYHEGLSRVLMEAIASARPVITTNIPGCRETVDQGVNGMLVEPKNSESLTRACREFIEMKAEQKQAMSRASRHKAENQFDINDVWHAYHKIIQTVLKKSV